MIIYEIKSLNISFCFSFDNSSQEVIGQIAVGLLGLCVPLTLYDGRLRPLTPKTRVTYHPLEVDESDTKGKDLVVNVSFFVTNRDLLNLCEVFYLQLSHSPSWFGD